MEARVSSLMNLARLHPSRARVPWASPTPCVRPRCPTPVTLDPVRMEARAPCQHWTPTSARVHVAGPGPRVQKLITVPISRVEMELSAFLMETTTNASVNQDSRVPVVKLTSMNVSSWPTPVFMEDAKTRMEDTGKITIYYLILLTIMVGECKLRPTTNRQSREEMIGVGLWWYFLPPS